MADNVTLDAMSGGDTVGADDIGGVKFQRVKIIEGADGTNDGDISSANGLPVELLAGTAAFGKLAANSGVDIGDVDVITLPADPLGANADAAATAGSTGSISAKLRLATSQLDSIKTAVEIIDNVVSGAEAQVDVVAALPAGTNAIGKLAANSGVDIGDVDVITLPADPLGANADAAATAGSTGSLSAKMRLMTSQLDSIKTAVETLDNVVGGSEAQVDIVGALPAGTNGIGKLTANSGVDIGDVDVLSIAAGTSLIGDVDIQPRTTGGWSVGNFTSGDGSTALTNGAQVIKASAGKFGGYYFANPNTVDAFVIVYNVAAASVTVGTTTPKLVFRVPAGAAANVEMLAGIPFDTAMSIAAASTAAGNGAPTTALDVMVYYK